MLDLRLNYKCVLRQFDSHAGKWCSFRMDCRGEERVAIALEWCVCFVKSWCVSPDSLVGCLQRRMLWLLKVASLRDVMILRSELLFGGTFGTDKLQQWSPRLLYSAFLSFVGSLDQFFLSSVPFTHELTTPFIHADLQLHTLFNCETVEALLWILGGGEQMSFSEMKQQLLFLWLTENNFYLLFMFLSNKHAFHIMVEVRAVQLKSKHH